MPGKAFIDHFSALDDPRQAWKVVYPLPEILLVVLCAIVTCAVSLGCRRPGPPPEITISGDAVFDGKRLRLVVAKGETIGFRVGHRKAAPVTLAVAIEQNPDPANPSAEASAQTPPKSRVLVFGTSRLGSNEVFQDREIGNRVANMDLFVNGSSWLVGDDELISIRPRPTDDRTLFLSAAQKNFIMLSSMVLVPAVVMAVGILIWWSRR